MKALMKQASVRELLRLYTAADAERNFLRAQLREAEAVNASLSKLVSQLEAEAREIEA